MTSNASIQAAISSARALDIAPDDMIALIDKAIAASLASGDLPVVSMGEGGGTLSFTSITDIQNARKYWVAQRNAQNGGVLFSQADFS